METESQHAPGVHYLIELSEVPREFLVDAHLLERTLEGCARRGGAQVIQTLLHQFSPQGLSGVVIIAESHLAVHTWPELDYAAVDIFTCGKEEIAEAIYQQILKAFTPRKYALKKLSRGPQALRNREAEP